MCEGDRVKEWKWRVLILPPFTSYEWGSRRRERRSKAVDLSGRCVTQSKKGSRLSYETPSVLRVIHCSLSRECVQNPRTARSSPTLHCPPCAFCFSCCCLSKILAGRSGTSLTSLFAGFPLCGERPPVGQRREQSSV